MVQAPSLVRALAHDIAHCTPLLGRQVTSGISILSFKSLSRPMLSPLLRAFFKLRVRLLCGVSYLPFTLRMSIAGVSPSFEAEQRYFAYRAILVATVSQNSFVLVLLGIAQSSRDMLQIGVLHNHRAICCKLGYCTEVPARS